ncbi:flagellar protein regulator [Proteus mirabilis]
MLIAKVHTNRTNPCISYSFICRLKWIFPLPQFAHVVSATPIKSTVFVTEEYCHRIGLPTQFTPEKLSRFHPAEQECRVFYMIEALNNKSIAHFPYAQFRECIPIYRQERRVIGYDVLYTIDGTPGKVRTTFKPGDIIALDSDTTCFGARAILFYE